MRIQCPRCGSRRAAITGGNRSPRSGTTRACLKCWDCWYNWFSRSPAIIAMMRAELQAGLEASLLEGIGQGQALEHTKTLKLD